MNATEAPPTLDVAQRLREAEAMLEALLSGQIDAVVDPKTQTPILLAKAQDSLRESEERYRQIVETTTDGILKADEAARVTFANGRLAEMLGYNAREMVGMSELAFMSAEAQATSAGAPRAGVGAKDVKDALDTTFRHKDGTSLSVNLVSTALVDGAGRCVGHLAVVRDVTERKRLQSQLRVSEEQLRHAQKMEAVGRLAGGVAHDFNNVLSVILSYAEMIMSDLKPEEPLRADVREISRAALRATDLTRQLLAFSRQQVLEAKVLNLSQELAGMQKMLGRLLGADIELTTLAANDLWNVKADPGQVEQIVMNLAVNARDAMPRGGKLTLETVNVELDDEYASTHHGVTAGSYVMVAVSDTGIGMDAATHARIFEPFFTTKEQGKGTGLGLATVFGIVKQSGGHIWVYSEPGKGTTFRVFFPRVSGAAQVRPSERPLAEPTRGSETILLVEDDDQLRAVACGVLRRNGYVVLEAANGGEALLIGEQHGSKIHLLLTDVVLPRMSGRQVAERLATERPQMKVLFMSGYTDDAVLQHGVLDSGVAYLQKPLTPTSLIRKVAEVLRGGNGG